MLGAALAPAAAVVGPIPNDGKQVPLVKPEILLTALGIAVVFTAVSFVIRRETIRKDGRSGNSSEE